MKNLKKVMALVIVFTMMLSTVVFAADVVRFSDVTDADLAKATERLANLQILTGYEDGTFAPEKAITRAEFATIAVKARGLETAAQSSKGITQFTDVKADHWASGFINVAVQQQIIKGYPDGTFKPEANVTHAEALAMMVRMLGYEDTTIGEWPTKYLVKAAQLGITQGVTVSSDVEATRGQVAFFTDNALDTPMWIIRETEDGKQKWGEGPTLLEDSLRVIRVIDAVIEETPLSDSQLEKDEIKIFVNEADKKGVYYKNGVSGAYPAPEGKYVVKVTGFDAKSLIIGEEVDMLVQDSNRDGQLQSAENTVVGVERKQTVVTGIVKEVKDGRIELKDGTKIRFANDAELFYNLDLAGVAYKTAGYADADLNNHHDTAANAAGLKDAYVQIVENSSSRATIIRVFQNRGGVSNAPENVIFDKVDGDNLYVKKPYLKSVIKVDIKDKPVYVFKDGEFIETDELEQGDVLNIYAQGDVRFILASSEVQAQQLKWIESGDMKGKVVLEDGTKITISYKAGFAEEGKDPKEVMDSSSMTDLSGNDAEVKLNFFGQAAFVTGTISSSSSKVVYIAKEAKSGLNDGKFKVLTFNGDVITYIYKNQDASNFYNTGAINTTLTTAPAGSVVIDLKLNSDNKVEDGVAADVGLGTAATLAASDVIDKDNSRIKFNNNSYISVDSSTKFIYTGPADSGDWKVYNWDDIKNSTLNSATVLYDTTSSGVLDWMVIYSRHTITAGDAKYAVITATSKAGSKDYYTVLGADGESETYEKDSGTAAVKDVVKYTTTSDGKIRIEDTQQAQAFMVVAFSESGKQITLRPIGGGADIMRQFASDVLIAKGDELKGFSDITPRNDVEADADATIVNILQKDGGAWNADTSLIQAIRIN